MNAKIDYALKKSKSMVVMILILWVVLSIVLIAPFTVASIESKQPGKGSVIDILFDNVSDVGSNLSKCFSKEYRTQFFKGELYLFVGISFFAIVGFVKSLPQNDYAGIENGSSDWATGEQYSILSKNKGILLAEKHYLPVDKRGNVNVLVVGRFWIW